MYARVNSLKSPLTGEKVQNVEAFAALMAITLDGAELSKTLSITMTALVAELTELKAEVKMLKGKVDAKTNASSLVSVGGSRVMGKQASASCR